MTARTPRATSPSHTASQSRRGVLRAGAAGGLAALLGSAGLLTGCGDGDIVSALAPNRFIAFGDGLSDLGQGGTRYTINDGTLNNWTAQLAANYGKTLTAQKDGGLSYARGHAPGAAATTALSAQIDQFLASQTLVSNDVVLMNLPMTEVLLALAAVKAGTMTEADAMSQADAAGQAYAAQVKRLVAAGARYVVVAGLYDLGLSPWVKQLGLSALAREACLGLKGLNAAFMVAIGSANPNVLVIDAGLQVGYFATAATASTYGFVNIDTAICTTPDASTCTTSTLVAGATASQYVFADGVHLTPSAQQQIGTAAYNSLRGRW